MPQSIKDKKPKKDKDVAITISTDQRNRLEAAMRALRQAKQTLANRLEQVETVNAAYETARQDLVNATAALQAIQDELLGA